MNHYDDLQRFKDKTRNQKYEFKDLSAQNLSPDHGSWAIMNQLAPATEESKLAMGGHVSLPQPQAVAPDVFASDERHERVESIDTIDSIESAETSTETSTESVLPPVDTDLPAVTARLFSVKLPDNLHRNRRHPLRLLPNRRLTRLYQRPPPHLLRLRQRLLIIPGCLQRKRQKQNPP